MQKEQQRSIAYPAPPEAAGNSNFTVRVRQGSGEWQRLISYNVKVDMHDMRVEPFELGRLFDIRVLFNPKYNPEPGKQAENILFENISFHGECEPSLIQGFDDSRLVEGVRFRNLRINDRYIAGPDAEHFHIGPHANDIEFS
ncbi:hypothetical protein [Paenibacillus macerans]|uniref:hypothetical protein n=1 Tax=Paenibacillus macerans TaxID=44252 RepID=UPI003D31A0BB